MDEIKIMLRSIEISNIPRFLDFDVPLFNGIVRDLFPKIELQKQEYPIIINAIKEEF